MAGSPSTQARYKPEICHQGYFGQFGSLSNETTAVGSRGSSSLGSSIHREYKTDKAMPPEGEKTMCLAPTREAKRWVQPKNMSETMAEGGEGWDWNQKAKDGRVGRGYALRQTVMVRSMAVAVKAKRWVKSKRGMMWPCAGKGKTRMWELLLKVAM
ncbi:hypothetical protein GOBAR_AA10173 [Gossypium barbadense]|uniref:Uncharacterized protein n=1 Tax=Gossypium barbadense TaxID=3634 RepID=A0A2P5Y4G6_GOSBA|nr:hypothetical protein GOBAR_AA10173 [Gossypium barbadense]